MAVLGDQTLKLIARELARAVKNSVSINRSARENLRANRREIIKRILWTYG